MKRILKPILLILGVLIGGLVIALLVFQLKPLPNYQEEVAIPDLKVSMDSAQVAQGQKIATMLCTHCHSSGHGSLAGRKFAAATPEWGTIYASNLTQDPEHGIATYTDGELYRLLRTGVKKDGEVALPMMIRSRYLADADIKALIAFLRSDESAVQAVAEAHPKNSPALVGRILLNLAIKPLPYPEEPVEVPPVSDQVAYGKYLVTAQMQCFECHSQSFQTNNWLEPEQSEGFLGGGTLIYGEDHPPMVSANITMDNTHGIGNWTENEFISTVKWGKKPDGSQIRLPMIPYTLLDTAEVQAIYAYLQTVPPLAHEVVAAAVPE